MIMYEGVVVYSGQCPRLESLARVGRGISPQHGLQGVGDRTLNTFFVCILYTVLPLGVLYLQQLHLTVSLLLAA